MRSSQSQAGIASAIACLFLGTSVLAQGEPVFPRSYLEDVCKPAIKNPGDVIPPCINIETIEAACHANGTTGLYLEAHQQCMCRGSFFPEWFACLDCVYLHGLRSPREFAFYQAVGSAASTSFCAAATPTAEWSKVFSSQENAATQVSTGATVGSDSAPSQTAVSLYYTPTGPQGPGAITGSATAATATGSTSTPASSSGSSSKSGSTTGGSSGTQTTSSGSSTTTQPNAAGRAQLGAGSIVFTVLLMGSKLLL